MKEKISKISLRTGLCLLPIVAVLPVAMMFGSNFFPGIITYRITCYILFILFCIMSAAFLMALVTRPVKPMFAKVCLIIGLFMFLFAFGFLFFTLFINATFWFTAGPEPFQTILKAYIIATVAAFFLALISEIVYLIVKAIKNRKMRDVK
mgnify:CR=1 FL=1